MQRVSGGIGGFSKKMWICRIFKDLSYLGPTIRYNLSLDRSISAFIANIARCLFLIASQSSSFMRDFSKSNLVASSAMSKICASVSAFICTSGLLTRTSSYSCRCLFVLPIYSFKRYDFIFICRAKLPALRGARSLRP